MVHALENILETVVRRQNAHYEGAGIKGPHPCESFSFAMSSTMEAGPEGSL